MRFVWNCLGLLSVLAVGALGARPAVADSYAVYSVVTDNGRSTVGIYGDGRSLVWATGCVETNYDACYRTFDHGQLANISATQPTQAFDNGWACTFSVAGFQEAGRCNGNYQAFTVSTFDPLTTLMKPGIYAGALGDPALLMSDAYESAAPMFLNSRGDVLFDDIEQEQIYQAYNTTPTPEPGSMVLLVTGLGAGALLQRRVLG